MKVRTNVKINLGLNVLRKRPDGYHDLETLFVPYFGLGDDLEMEESPSMEVDIAPCDWDPQTDLTVRAYRLLASDFDLPPVRISLRKGAPVGAGLGGGSADAAFALKCVDALFGLGLSDEALAGYAARLGSDCAFFVYNRPMIGEGRGEILSPYPLDFGRLELRVVVPDGVSVSTREAYGGIVPRFGSASVAGGLPDVSSCPQPSGNSASGLPSLREALALPVEEWRGRLVNDFETTVFKAHPELAELKEQLYSEGALYASMSGSGSALFGIFKP